MFHGGGIGGLAMHYRQQGSPVGNVYRKAEFSFVGRNGGNVVTNTQWRIPLVQPANYSQPHLHMIIDFAKFYDFAGGAPSTCNLRLRLTGQQDPKAIPTGASEESGLPKL